MPTLSSNTLYNNRQQGSSYKTMSTMTFAHQQQVQPIQQTQLQQQSQSQNQLQQQQQSMRNDENIFHSIPHQSSSVSNERLEFTSTEALLEYYGMNLV